MTDTPKPLPLAHYPRPRYPRDSDREGGQLLLTLLAGGVLGLGPLACDSAKAPGAPPPAARSLPTLQGNMQFPEPPAPDSQPAPPAKPAAKPRPKPRPKAVPLPPMAGGLQAPRMIPPAQAPVEHPGDPVATNQPAPALPPPAETR